MGAGPKRNRAALNLALKRGGVVQRGRGEKRPAPPASAQENAGQETSPGPPPQLSNPSPAAVLPGHVSTGSLPVRPKDFLKPPHPAARKSCESVRRESPANPTPAAATRVLGSWTQRPELHSSAQTALRKGETQMARRGCELAAVCHQELLRMPQSEALGVTSLGSPSGSPNLPCNSNPHPQKAPHAAPSP